MSDDNERRLGLALAREAERHVAGRGVVVPFPDVNEPNIRQGAAAAHLGVSLSTLRRWQLRGLPMRKVGGVALYKASQLDAWVRDHAS